MNKFYIYKKFMWMCFSFFLAGLDIVSKCWIKTYFLIGEKLYIFPGINFCYINNKGLAFGLFSNIPESYYWIFLWSTIILTILFIIFLYRFIGNISTCGNLSYSMLIGGAVGNMYDRITNGSVIDFIDFHLGLWHYPIFNVADIEIFVGICILIMQYYFDAKKDRNI